MVDTAHCHCSPIHGKYRDTPRYYDVDYPLLRMLLAAGGAFKIAPCTATCTCDVIVREGGIPSFVRGELCHMLVQPRSAEYDYSLLIAAK